MQTQGARQSNHYLVAMFSHSRQWSNNNASGSVDSNELTTSQAFPGAQVTAYMSWGLILLQNDWSFCDHGIDWVLVSTRTSDALMKRLW